MKKGDPCPDCSTPLVPYFTRHEYAWTLGRQKANKGDVDTGLLICPRCQSKWTEQGTRA